MLFLILFIILIVLLFVILYFFNLAFVKNKNDAVAELDPSINKSLEKYKDVIDEGNQFIQNQPHKWYYTTSFDGKKLAARYYNNDSDRTILLFHGYRSSAAHDFSCAVNMYFNFGFNVLLVDQRSHGRSEGRLITFGIKESDDVHSWVDFLNAKFSPKEIILSGISMGATTVLLSLKKPLPNNIKGIIADCGFTSPVDIIKCVAKRNFKINADFFIPFLDFACKIFGKFSIQNISTVDTVKKCDIPILFIHGEKDDFVPCEMSKQAYSVCGKNAKIVLSKNAGHGISFLIDTEKVVIEIYKFFKENLNNFKADFKY